MGDESAAWSEIELPNQNIPEQCEEPKGSKSQGMSSTHP